ncbi:hypothetical protein B0G62_10435 [Paraburkholderia eburnea]|uniref:Uncharacterized protein n=1 Tax=Paraburkholderia eburnea TaxID=1189126 RepID=A0A2S4MDA8_9BURK|nr:hypothetical protein [Paraburkholderia eburnea]POR52738.1 hypothetical protein B0G62_10435 [Paraburkholderia eburnea]PRZ23606.1 hypothetical protein BX588_10435 [Paraburkholderia eburnea]
MPNFLITLRRLLSSRLTRCAPIPDPSSSGPSAPSASSRTNIPYAEQPKPASTACAPEALSTEMKESTMNISLSTIAAAIVSGATAIETAISDVATVVADVKKLVAYVPDLMETFENAYASVTAPDAGAGKLAGVLAALEAVAVKIGADWNDNVKAIISAIIAQAKAAYNAVVSLPISAAAAPATA